MSPLVLQGIASGIVTGCVYALIAISLVIVYKSSDVINFAGGEMVMLGGYLGLFALIWLELPYVLIFAFGAETQPWRLKVVPSGMKTGPALPGAPLWMCAALPLPSMCAIEKSQQTLPVDAFSLISTRPLFDTERYCRQIEAAYTTMWESWQRGEAPESFSVVTTVAS